MRVIVFLVLCFARQDVICKKPGNSKIVGGYSVSIESFPHQVYLIVQRGNNYNACGGSIISRNYILTAAHCLEGTTKAYIRTGSAKSNSGGKMYISTNFTRHPNYNGNTIDYDVGLLSPSVPITLDNRTKIVPLANKDAAINAGTQILVSGWGTTSENGASSNTLMAVEISTVSNDECRKKYKSLTERMFCAGVPQGGKDSCQGDSGGPAVLKSSKVQLGIVSFGMGCARQGYPGVYARISNSGVRDWIKKVSGV